MSIELVRIDDRLIHGQVATTWLRDYQIEQVLIVDDAVNEDPVQKNMVMLAAPEDIKVRTFGVAHFVDVVKNHPIRRRTLLLFTGPTALKKVLDSGVDLQGKEVVVGGMRAQPERKKVSKAVHISTEEERLFREMAKGGISFVVQTVPRDEKSDLLKIL